MSINIRLKLNEQFYDFQVSYYYEPADPVGGIFGEEYFIEKVVLLGIDDKYFKDTVDVTSILNDEIYDKLTAKLYAGPNDEN